MTIPAGWTQHPTSPGYMYQGDQVIPIPQTPAVPTTPPVVAGSSSVEDYQYGSANVDEQHSEYERTAFNFGKDIWLDFPEKVKNVGDVSELRVRFLPPWAPGEKDPYVKLRRFRIPASLWPNCEKEFEYVLSYNTPGGPGEDPIEAAIARILTVDDPALAKKIKAYKPKLQYTWQGVSIDDPSSHWVQATDDNGNQILGADNQPIWQLQPGLISMPQTLARSILKYFKLRNIDFTLPNGGFGFILIKRKVGKEDFDVDYDAVDLAPEPIAADMIPILGNLIDLRQSRLFFRPSADQHKCAELLLSKFMPQSAQQQVPAGYPVPSLNPAVAWVVHPTNPAYEYNPATNGLRERVVAAPPIPVQASPPVVPPPAVPPPVVPPVIPPVVPPPVSSPVGTQLPGVPPTPPAPPVPAVPGSPGVPPGVSPPPPVAPGIAAGQQPVGVPDAPGPIVPGMPPGVPLNPASLPNVPPAPPAVPGAMGQSEFEDSLKNGPPTT